MNKIVGQIYDALENKKRDLYEAISKDYLENKKQISYNLLIDVIKKLQDIKEVNNENNPKTILAIFNGNIYIALEIIIKAITQGKNIILVFENNQTHTIRKIISIIQEIEGLPILKIYEEINLNRVLKEKNLIDRIIYFGDKRKYRVLRLNTNIEILYNGYGSINVYVDDEDEFELELTEIQEYAINNENFVYMHTDDIDEAIETINQDGKNYICICLSKDEEKIEKFKKKINSSNILINETKFENIKYEIPDEL